MEEHSYSMFSYPQNRRVNELLQQYERNNNLQHRLRLESKQRQAKTSYLLQTGWRKWLNQKGKGYLVDFDEHERKKLKAFFNTLDRNKTGSIGVDELEQMLLSLGLARSLDEVKSLMGNIDEDHSGKIEFEEFIDMIQDDSKENEVVVNFFKQLIFTQMSEKTKEKQHIMAKLSYNKIMEPSESQKQIFHSKMPFEMIVNRIRRNHILASMNIGRCKSRGDPTTVDKVKKGREVVKALQKMDERRMLRTVREGGFLETGSKSVLTKFSSASRDK